MSIKEHYLSVFLLIVVLPAMILFAPNALTYILVLGLVSIFFVFRIAKPRRRCLPCGEIVTLNPLSYLKLLKKRLNCPRCGTALQNNHRV